MSWPGNRRRDGSKNRGQRRRTRETDRHRLYKNNPVQSQPQILHHHYDLPSSELTWETWALSVKGRGNLGRAPINRRRSYSMESPPILLASQRQWSYTLAIAKTVTQIGDVVGSNGAEMPKECVPDPNRRAKIC
ncbi:hypothetical protein U1Q18_033245 [Sarracenia purpurea var. burkii]